jgi:hypothetical protein
MFAFDEQSDHHPPSGPRESTERDIGISAQTQLRSLVRLVSSRVHLVRAYSNLVTTRFVVDFVPRADLLVFLRGRRGPRWRAAGWSRLGYGGFTAWRINPEFTLAPRSASRPSTIVRK